MLQITIPAGKLYDEVNNEFINPKEQTLQLEHSLVSLSKWESKWHKPFLGRQEKSVAELQDYVRCMTLTQNVDRNCYFALTPSNFREIQQYIDDPMTATTFSNSEQKPTNREIITAEIIYYLMIVHNVPFECQKWHLNRLLTLINVCGIRNQPAQKLSPKEAAARRKALNESRRAKYNTRG